MPDERTAQERLVGYPPAKATMVRRCTVPVTGVPHPFLFDQVVAHLVTYLNTPNLRPSDLIADVRDAAGSYTRVSLFDVGSGRGFRGRLAKAPGRLILAAPQSWLEILRVKDVGPDTFYDMWRLALTFWIRTHGETLGAFIRSDGTPSHGSYFAVRSLSDPGLLEYVVTDRGIPFRVDSQDTYVFPSQGEFGISPARPNLLLPGGGSSYRSSDLSPDLSMEVSVDIHPSRPILRVGMVENDQNVLRVFHDPATTAVQLHPVKARYPSETKVVSSGKPARYDEYGMPCGSCAEFAFTKQEELEDPPLTNLSTSVQLNYTEFRGVPPGRYVVAGLSPKGIIVSTVRDVRLDRHSVREIGLDHTYDLTRLSNDPPPRAFLQGDIVRQNQRSTRWCGPFALAHAFSYWAPDRFNPLDMNGKWAGETIRDGPTTWLHTLLGFLTFGLSYAALAIFADDPVPGTLPETLVMGCRRHGFSNQGYAFDDIPKDEALGYLKRWIAAGVPVIVTVDEKMDQGKGHWSSEHYKVLVGYDDSAQVHYVDDGGLTHVSTGAFYFANSGGRGESRSDPEVLAPELRETHPDYNWVQLGNDIDSFTVFWKKWKTGGIPTFSKSNWCLPVFPFDHVKVYKI